MCTVSWLHEDGGYQLLCNRDEKRSRAAAEPPRPRERGGVRYLAPLDPEGRGAWIGTNEFGVTVCLLNRAGGSGVRSRGLLTWDLLDLRGTGEVRERLGAAGLGEYAGFTLAVLEPRRPALVAEWDGIRLEVAADGESRMPLISSSVDPEDVRARRREEFDRLLSRSSGRVTAPLLFSFHQSHGSGPSAWSPCMHRPDAHTVSFTWVRVGRERIELFYYPKPLCVRTEGERQSLVRRYLRAA